MLPFVRLKLASHSQLLKLISLVATYRIYSVLWHFSIGLGIRLLLFGVTTRRMETVNRLAHWHRILIGLKRRASYADTFAPPCRELLKLCISVVLHSLLSPTPSIFANSYIKDFSSEKAMHFDWGAIFFSCFFMVSNGWTGERVDSIRITLCNKPHPTVNCFHRNLDFLSQFAMRMLTRTTTVSDNILSWPYAVLSTQRIGHCHFRPAF